MAADQMATAVIGPEACEHPPLWVAATTVRAAGKDALLVALSGWGQDKDMAESSGAGFNHHLVKPVNMSELESLRNSSLAAQ
jgi:hypothetical protein